jgi:restriction endonuclease S subunit
MTDKEIYERFMLWMGMKTSKTKTIGKNTVVRYNDIDNCDVRFTKTGYDEFYAGAMFDENGKIVKAYIDSHVAYVSDNSKEIDKMLKD